MDNFRRRLHALNSELRLSKYSDSVTAAQGEITITVYLGDDILKDAGVSVLSSNSFCDCYYNYNEGIITCNYTTNSEEPETRTAIITVQYGSQSKQYKLIQDEDTYYDVTTEYFIDDIQDVKPLSTDGILYNSSTSYGKISSIRYLNLQYTVIYHSVSTYYFYSGKTTQEEHNNMRNSCYFYNKMVSVDKSFDSSGTIDANISDHYYTNTFNTYFSFNFTANKNTREYTITMTRISTAWYDGGSSYSWPSSLLPPTYTGTFTF